MTEFNQYTPKEVMFTNITDGIETSEYDNYPPPDAMFDNEGGPLHPDLQETGGRMEAVFKKLGKLATTTLDQMTDPEFAGPTGEADIGDIMLNIFTRSGMGRY